MLKETIHFTDFNDEPAVTTEYFNLSKNEIITLEKSIPGGLASMMRKVQDNATIDNILDLLKILTHASYGIKSDDGKFFDKSPEITNRFVRSAFYDDYLFSLLENDAAKGLAFIKGVLPQSLVDAAEKQITSTQAAQGYQPDARESFERAQTAKSVPVQPTPPSTFVPSAPEPAIEPQRAPYPAPQDAAEAEAFRQWQAERAAQAFRVREEEPTSVLPRPVHEQTGPAQP